MGRGRQEAAAEDHLSLRPVLNAAARETRADSDVPTGHSAAPAPKAQAMTAAATAKPASGLDAR